MYVASHSPSIASFGFLVESCLESIAERSICSQLLVMTERALSGGFDLEKKLSMNNNLLEKQSKDAEESVLSAFEL